MTLRGALQVKFLIGVAFTSTTDSSSIPNCREQHSAHTLVTCLAQSYKKHHHVSAHLLGPCPKVCSLTLSHP
ncbi:hypothetical protein BVRB_7g157170 [Beta vulgaris subsp. vulgaris]|nr:hypothetical protein BVRB_7g157170 [Beta vulgaris subsp. vulgaris]